MLCLFIRGDYVKIINIDVIKQTYDVSPVEGDVNVIKVKFINTPSEWENNGYGVYALFTKDNDSEIMKVDKDTWECEIPNRMVAVNSGVKVILYAMNSDTTNPKRWVIDPVWVAISEGLDNSYDVTATSGLNKDNMDAISTLIQVISSYVDAEAERVEAEKKRADAEIKRQGMIKDLGSFENADAYNEAIDNAKESGLYKVQYTEDKKVIPGLFLVIAGVNNDGKELVYQMQLRGSYLNKNKTCIPLMRVYADSAWSDSTYQFESSYYKNSNITDNANSDEMYPSNKGVSDYVINEVGKLIGGAPDALNTLGKLATAIGNNEDFAGDVSRDIASLRDSANGAYQTISEHIADYKNPHQVTKNQLGLGNVDNTSDEDKLLSKAAREALDLKVDKVPGMGLSSNDFTDLDKLEIKEAYYLMGDLSFLDTQNADSLVDAINEVHGLASVHIKEGVSGTLNVNTEYYLGITHDLTLTFPSNASPGDVVYINFFSPEQPTVLTIDMTNVFDIEIIPEPDTGYEIFGKYTPDGWIVNYSEFSLDKWYYEEAVGI